MRRNGQSVRLKSLHRSPHYERFRDAQSRLPRLGSRALFLTLPIPSFIIVLWIFACLLTPPEVSAQEPASSNRAFQSSEFVIPQEWGHVAQIFEASTTHSPSAHLIVIQDAHVNYEAQRHLVDILDRLASDYGVRLILVEGGTGDVSLSFLHQRGPKAVRQQVAEERLRTGMLSGEEYLNMVSDHPLLLWGVDDPVLYDTQLKLFIELEQGREGVLQDLAQLRQVVERLQANGFNEALRKFEAARASFEAVTLSFGAYLDELVQACERLGIRLADYPSLSRMLTVRKVEAEIDTRQTQEEQRQILEQLSARIPEADLQHLQEIAGQLQTQQVEPTAFYAELETLMPRAGLTPAAWPHLSRYIDYVRLKTQLQPRPLWAELAQLTREVRSRLVHSTPEAQRLSLADRIALCERLARLDWAPEDDRSYRHDPAQIRVSQWVPALQDQAERDHVAFDWAGDREAVDAYLAHAVRFYDLAQLRDAEMVRRTLAKMETEGEQLAVLITGGFHTDNLLTLLAEQPVEVVVITPLAGPDDQTRYAQIMKAKYRQYQQHLRRAGGAR